MLIWGLVLGLEESGPTAREGQTNH